MTSRTSKLQRARTSVCGSLPRPCAPSSVITTTLRAQSPLRTPLGSSPVAHEVCRTDTPLPRLIIALQRVSRFLLQTSRQASYSLNLGLSTPMRTPELITATTRQRPYSPLLSARQKNPPRKQRRVYRRKKHTHTRRHGLCSAAGLGGRERASRPALLREAFSRTSCAVSSPCVREGGRGGLPSNGAGQSTATRTVAAALLAGLLSATRRRWAIAEQ